MTQARCESCGGVFDLTKPNRRYCSEACRKSAEGLRRRAKHGPQTHGKRRIVSRECEWCGRTFDADASEVARGRGRFCSLSCSGLHGSYLRTGPKYEPIRVVVCRTCGQWVTRTHSQQVYCSDECSPYERQLADDMRPCKHCGVMFYSPYTGGKRVEFCCDEHAREYQRDLHHKRMDQDPEYAARHRARKRARKFSLTAKQALSIEDKKTMLKGRCPDCGRKVKPGDWHIDHYVPRALGGPDSIDNYRPLCGDCNSKRKRALMPNAEYLAEREGGQLAIVCMV